MQRQARELEARAKEAQTEWAIANNLDPITLRPRRARTIEAADHRQERKLDYGRTRRARLAGATIETVHRQDIIERDGRTCYLCGKHNLEDGDLHLDHVIPLSRGGSHTPDNLKVSCARCNTSKGDRMPSDPAC